MTSSLAEKDRLIAQKEQELNQLIVEYYAFDMSDRGVVQERCARLSAALPPGILDEVIPLVARCQRPTAGQPLDTPQMEIHP